VVIRVYRESVTRGFLMAVQFILGRSGTGKTQHCVKAIVEALLSPGEMRPLLFLVPEQATYQAERAILSDGRVEGYSRLHVLSFDRLGFLVRGKKSPGPRISELGKVMLIHKILQTNKTELKLLGSSANRPGLAAEMRRVIEELQRYDQKAKEVIELAAELQKEDSGSISGLKFADIGLIYGEYLRFIEGRFINPDTELTAARKALGETNFIKGASLWVDGFAGFTVQEMTTLMELLKVVWETQIALCLDPQKIDQMQTGPRMSDGTGLFSPTERTYTELVGLIKKCGIGLSEPICLEKRWRFASSPELGHIEHNLFEPDSSAKIKPAEKVRVASASNARAETQFVAREILNLVKKEKLRFRDIAVVAPELSSYQHYIRALFNDYGIPFFIDMRRPLRQHPLIGLILSALRAVSYDFCNSDIFAFLKTDLAPIGRGDVDMLENYCLAFGIGPKDWKQQADWQFAGGEESDFDEKQINQIRREATEALLELDMNLLGAKEKIRPKEFTQVVFSFLEKLGIHSILSEWIEQALEADDLEKANEHRQCYGRVVDIFEELAEIFSGEMMRIEEYLLVVDSAFSNMTLAFIPPRLEEVLVGSIERSRHPELKVVFLIGASQKRFPVPISPEGIVTDQDRVAAEKKNLLLAETVEQQLIARQYLAYIAFTRASQQLYITYPMADEKGNALAPSDFLADVESLFEDFSEEFFEAEDCSLDEVHSEAELTDLVCAKLGWDAENKPTEPRPVGTELEGLPAALSTDQQLEHIGKIVSEAINYDNTARLDKDFVEEQSGDIIKKSITELTSYAACPYQHFSKYTLGLRSRRIFKLEPLDLGIFYHNLLDSLAKQLRNEGKDFATITVNELLAFLHTGIYEQLTSDSFISNFIQRSAHNAFIVDTACKILEDCVVAIAEMVRAGKFRPAETEVVFGETGKGLGQFELPLSNNRRLYLRGKIDRLDIGRVGEKNLAVVFDYKRSSREFSWAEFYHGLDMQLPVYLLALRNKKIADAEKLEPAGGFYMPIEVKPATEGKGKKFIHKARGIVNGEFTRQLDSKTPSGRSIFYNFAFTKNGPYGYYNYSGALRPDDFEKILEFAEMKITKLAEESVSGRIDVNPYRLKDHSPCAWCEYRAVCRFEWPINDYNHLEAVSKEQMLEIIGADDGN